MEMKRFFAELDSRLAEARRADENKYERFFAELAPRLETAKQLDAELDRHLARRFNVFDYLRTDELGLSRVIADLLNPRATHGQGKLFLETLLERIDHDSGHLGSFREWLPLSALRLEASRVSVTTERTIPSGRRIDVVVEIVDPDGRTGCLAIENKPYAGDQANQVRDYLEYLKEKYPEGFLLLYLSPTGEGPSTGSVDPGELEAKWKGRFGIVSYHGGEVPRSDEYDDYRFPFSLAGWLEECRSRCEVDRLRWFLCDAEKFCRRTFGGQIMTTDSEARVVRDFLFSNPDYLEVARNVHDTWPETRDTLCRTFLERLCSRIERKLKDDKDLKGFASDMRVDCKYEGEKRWSKRIWLYRNRWFEYSGADGELPRTAILLEADGKGPEDWRIGVRNPVPESGMGRVEEKLRREHLVELLRTGLGDGRGSIDWWPWWDWADERWRNWNVLLPALQRENEGLQDGEITDYFVDKFNWVATKAIPIINEVEGLDT